ncbi:hypothetical protein BDB01DRAFT_898786 [Pilobolus umbonatus]|nr:hypothetical protein BDB01DRAFT_898786 [Pilobolus umbonatus]
MFVEQSNQNIPEIISTDDKRVSPKNLRKQGESRVESFKKGEKYTDIVHKNIAFVTSEDGGRLNIVTVRGCLQYSVVLRASCWATLSMGFYWIIYVWKNPDLLKGQLTSGCPGVKSLLKDKNAPTFGIRWLLTFSLVDPVNRNNTALRVCFNCMFISNMRCCQSLSMSTSVFKSIWKYLLQYKDKASIAVCIGEYPLQYVYGLRSMERRARRTSGLRTCQIDNERMSLSVETRGPIKYVNIHNKDNEIMF